MTKRRPTNKKPTGVNRSLGSCLSNERQKAHMKHRHREQNYDAENMATMNKNTTQNINSVTDETSLEEFLAKVELAGRNFAAEWKEFRLLELCSMFNFLCCRENTKTVVNTMISGQSLDDLYKKYGDRLRIPRRPQKDLWETAEELTRLENEHFLEWRKGLADLQDEDGVLLTPFERNLELWRQLWRVVERSDIVVQILDARNPLLFRNVDLEAYVKECDAAKQNIYLVNKVDLLSEKQIESWRKWFLGNNIDAVFWSALGPESSNSAVTKDENRNHSGSEDTERDQPSSGIWEEERQCADVIKQKIPVINAADDLIAFFKSRGRVRTCDTWCRPLVVGMVGYPNVGKSSSINRMLNQKKVPVSSTPGKTRHFQTLMVDEELTLCDCPGLVMPSFALSRSDMVLNGILSIDHMRDYLSPVALLLTRIPRSYFEKMYSVLLTSIPDSTSEDRSVSAHDLLTAVAFIRGYMSSSGVADCSRAARLILKDVVSGKVKWVAAPPDVDQKEFDKLTYNVARGADFSKTKQYSGVMQQLEKRHLLGDMKISGDSLDEQFFFGSGSQAHIRTIRTIPKVGSAENETPLSKKHFNNRKKEKLRRIYVD